ncbi:MAG: hypothetical protein HUU21_14585 [Polyangiaceae bacterium]|nr:hypothetical protein [Polyangiaceae bacterium]
MAAEGAAAGSGAAGVAPLGAPSDEVFAQPNDKADAAAQVTSERAIQGNLCARMVTQYHRTGPADLI